MSVNIDTDLCTGCPDHGESPCEEVCPGDLFFRKDGKAVLREDSDCWDCLACVKACPHQALTVSLPFQICESRLRMTAAIYDDLIHWTVVDVNGRIVYECSRKNRIAKP